MTAYYNEHDPLKAEVIREAIKAGAVAPGDVDERSIKDVQPGDVRGYTQCHWFAGGAFWSLGLRNAGWPDTRPVWTGSCPCPSFSAAGKGGGFDDPRHLWPDWFRLIRECRPATVFGEQVGAAVRFGWFDLVHAGLEAEAYAVGAVVFGAHSVGAPHIRQRLYFVADTSRARPAELRWGREQSARPAEDVRLGFADHALGNGWRSGRYDDAIDERQQPYAAGPTRQPEHAASDGRLEWRAEPGGRSVAGGCGAGECADAEHDGFDPARRNAAIEGGDGAHHGIHADGGQPGDGDLQRGGEHGLFAEARGAGDDCSGADAASKRWRSGRAGCASDDYDQTQRDQGEREPERLRQNGDGLHPIGPRPQGHAGDERAGRGPGWLTPEQARSIAQTGATRGFWAGCDWWHGRDGRYRPIEPGLQPLAHGSPARVGRLRLYGDAIVVEQAQTWIEAYLES